MILGQFSMNEDYMENGESKPINLNFEGFLKYFTLPCRITLTTDLK